MDLEAPVSRIMTDNVVSIEKDTDLHDVVDLIRNKHIRHLPVVDKGEIVGIVSSTDINRLTFGGLFEDQDLADDSVLTMLNVSQVMTNKPKTVDESDSIRSIAQTLVEEPYHALPVVNDQNEVVGIVTTTDLIKFMLEKS